MTYRGRVKSGVVVFDPPAPLPEGAEVDVILTQEDQQAPSLAERYKDFIGIVEGLPGDSSRNHDHYLYGAPRQ